MTIACGITEHQVHSNDEDFDCQTLLRRNLAPVRAQQRRHEEQRTRYRCLERPIERKRLRRSVRKAALIIDPSFFSTKSHRSRSNPSFFSTKSHRSRSNPSFCSTKSTMVQENNQRCSADDSSAQIAEVLDWIAQSISPKRNAAI